MPTDEIIETMARAIATNDNPRRTFPEINEASRQVYRKLAQAAVIALDAEGSVVVPRESARVMIERLQFCLDTFGAIEDQSSEAADLDDWRAMIEARP